MYRIFVPVITIRSGGNSNTAFKMDIVYRIDGSDLTRENNSEYSPQLGWKVIVNGNKYLIDGLTVNMDEETPVIYADLVNEQFSLRNESLKNGIAKCVSPFDRSTNLTKGKDYPILKQNSTHFFITDDNGIKRDYKHGNSQFVILN